MEEKIQKELEELQKLSEAELDETQQNRLNELKSWADAEKTATEKSTDLQSALAQKEHFRTKAETAEAKLKELGDKNTNPDDKTEIWEASTDPLEIVKLGKTLKDYNEEETEFIIQNAPTKDINGIIEATKKPFVQIAIQAMREKVATERATPSPSDASSGGFRVKTQAEVAKMTPEEHKAYAEEFTKRRRKEAGV